MSKQIYTVTAETVISMIEEIHEEVTAVTMQSIGDVHTMILDSVAEDAEIECDIVAVITQWVADNAEPVAQQGTGFETMSADELREYAETVQAEYDADIITGAMGRTVVRHAWQRVAESAVA